MKKDKVEIISEVLDIHPDPIRESIFSESSARFDEIENMMDIYAKQEVLKERKRIFKKLSSIKDIVDLSSYIWKSYRRLFKIKEE